MTLGRELRYDRGGDRERPLAHLLVRVEPIIIIMIKHVIALLHAYCNVTVLLLLVYHNITVTDKYILNNKYTNTY